AVSNCSQVVNFFFFKFLFRQFDSFSGWRTRVSALQGALLTTILLVVLGLFAGLVGALSGTGGGIILTPMLALYFGLPIQQAIGTSLVAVITTSAASSSVHLQRH